MAKKRKHTGKKHGRRRVSGINKNSAMIMLASAAGGYFLGQKINDKLTDPVTGPLKAVDPKLIAGGEVLIGLFSHKVLPAKLKNNMLVKVAAGVLLGAGIHEGLKSFGIVSGVPLLAGYKDLKQIAGVTIPQAGGMGTSPAREQSLSSMQIIAGVETNCNAY